MKCILLTGDVIKPQLLLTNNSRRSAIDISTILRNKCKNLLQYRVKILGYDTEYCKIEEVNIKDLYLLLKYRLALLKR